MGAVGSAISRVVFRSDWPLDKLLWKYAHGFVNDLAWRFARPPGPTWGMGLRINKRHPLWRLNDWTAKHWSEWWIQRSLERSRES